ncbi:MAG: diguanylate cyclase [Gammaproteobacteria bacterium]
MNGTSNDWKNKYLNSLDELERKEQSWKQVEGVLRKAISRLTLIAPDSQHDSLNSKLAELRGAINDDSSADRLQTIVDDVSTLIQELDKQKQHTTVAERPNGVLLELLELFEFPKGAAGAGLALKKKIQAVKNEQDLRAVLPEFAGLFEETVNILLQEEFRKKSPDLTLPEKRPFLKRLLEKGGSESERKMQEVDAQRLIAPAAGELVLQLMLRLPPQVQAKLQIKTLKRKVTQARSRGDLLPIVDDLAKQLSVALPATPAQQEMNEEVHMIGEALLGLVNKLDLSTDLKNQVDVVRSMLSQEAANENHYLVIRGIENIADLVKQQHERITREKAELEKFLFETASRLKQIDTELQQTGQWRELSTQEGRNLDDSVRAAIGHINTSLDSSENLLEVRKAIRVRLDDIDRHMAGFRETEEQRSDNSLKLIKQLRKQLNAMEQEADLLRNQLQQKHSEALRDVLTGIPNRLAYEERLQSELARFKRYGKSFLCLVVDVDHFKVVNDTFGHSAGDRVLKIIAEVMQDNVRAADFVARFGGEEFVILMPETDLKSGSKVAEKLRRKIEKCDFYYRDNPVKITISGGITEADRDDSGDTIFDRADKALYEAKKSGRNRIVTL